MPQPPQLFESVSSSMQAVPQSVCPVVQPPPEVPAVPVTPPLPGDPPLFLAAQATVNSASPNPRIDMRFTGVTVVNSDVLSWRSIADRPRSDRLRFVTRAHRL